MSRNEIIQQIESVPGLEHIINAHGGLSVSEKITEGKWFLAGTLSQLDSAWVDREYGNEVHKIHDCWQKAALCSIDMLARWPLYEDLRFRNAIQPAMLKALIRETMK